MGDTTETVATNSFSSSKIEALSDQAQQLHVLIVYPPAPTAAKLIKRADSSTGVVVGYSAPVSVAGLVFLKIARRRPR